MDDAQEVAEKLRAYSPQGYVADGQPLGKLVQNNNSDCQ